MKKPKEGAAQRRMENRRYLFVLLGCAAVVMIVGFLLFGQPQFADTDSLSRYEYETEDTVSASDTVDNVPSLSVTEETTETEDDAETADEETTEESEPSEQTEAAVAEVPATPAFAAPTETAEITRSYSVDALSYDETMEDWRTHAATDYGGESGDAVTAVTDGTVLEIGEDTLYGKYIVIGHADDLTSRYAGITDISVEEGDPVTCGQQIAKLGDPMPAEAAQGVHLHLEILRGEDPVDVQTLLGNSDAED